MDLYGGRRVACDVKISAFFVLRTMFIVQLMVAIVFVNSIVGANKADVGTEGRRIVLNPTPSK